MEPVGPVLPELPPRVADTMPAPPSRGNTRQGSTGPLSTPPALQATWNPAQQKPVAGAPRGLRFVALGVAVLIAGTIGFIAYKANELLTGSKFAGSLETGDCITDFFDNNSEGEVGPIFLFPISDCTEPHALEVFAVSDTLYATGGDVFVGEDAAFNLGIEWCSQRFEPFVGESYDSSPLEIWTFVPTGVTWRQGDRRVICIVGNYDEVTTVTGSLRDSGWRVAS